MNQLISLYDFFRQRGQGPELGAQVYSFRSKYPDLTIGKRYIIRNMKDLYIYIQNGFSNNILIRIMRMRMGMSYHSNIIKV